MQSSVDRMIHINKCHTQATYPCLVCIHDVPPAVAEHIDECCVRVVDRCVIKARVCGSGANLLTGFPLVKFHFFFIISLLSNIYVVHFPLGAHITFWKGSCLSSKERKCSRCKTTDASCLVAVWDHQD